MTRSPWTAPLSFIAVTQIFIATQDMECLIFIKHRQNKTVMGSQMSPAVGCQSVGLKCLLLVQNLGTMSMSEPPKVGVKNSSGAQVMTIEGRRSPDTQSSNDSSKVGTLAGP